LREKRLDCEEAEIIEFPPPPSYFAINPLGQVPVLETSEGRLFPTSVILAYLMSMPPVPPHRTQDLPLASSLARDDHHWKDTQLLAAVLAFGDFLAMSKYQEWAGLEPVGKNVLGFVPAQRNAERAQRTLDWLESIATAEGFLPGCLSVQDIAVVCLILWTESRGPIEWRGRPRLEAMVARHKDCPSFTATAPKPWRPS
jgi:glutathione S-transferase